MNLGFAGVVVFAALAIVSIAWIVLSIERKEGIVPPWFGVRRAHRRALRRAGYSLGYASMAFDVLVRCEDCGEAVRMLLKPKERAAFNGMPIRGRKCHGVACLRCGYIETGETAERGHVGRENTRLPIGATSCE